MKLLNIEGEEKEELDDIENWEDVDYCDDNIGMGIDIAGLDADNVENVPIIKLND